MRNPSPPQVRAGFDVLWAEWHRKDTDGERPGCPFGEASLVGGMDACSWFARFSRVDPSYTADALDHSAIVSAASQTPSRVV